MAKVFNELIVSAALSKDKSIEWKHDTSGTSTDQIYRKFINEFREINGFRDAPSPTYEPNCSRL